MKTRAADLRTGRAKTVRANRAVGLANEAPARLRVEWWVQAITLQRGGPMARRNCHDRISAFRTASAPRARMGRSSIAYGRLLGARVPDRG
jgi:hypothetical protein